MVTKLEKELLLLLWQALVGNFNRSFKCFGCILGFSLVAFISDIAPLGYCSGLYLVLTYTMIFIGSGIITSVTYFVLFPKPNLTILGILRDIDLSYLYRGLRNGILGKMFVGVLLFLVWFGFQFSSRLPPDLDFFNAMYLGSYHAGRFFIFTFNLVVVSHLYLFHGLSGFCVMHGITPSHFSPFGPIKWRVYTLPVMKLSLFPALVISGIGWINGLNFGMVPVIPFTVLLGAAVIAHTSGKRPKKKEKKSLRQAKLLAA